MYNEDWSRLHELPSPSSPGVPFRKLQFSNLLLHERCNTARLAKATVRENVQTLAGALMQVVALEKKR